MANEASSLEKATGDLFGRLWTPYDATLFEESVKLFERRLDLAGFDKSWFVGKRCLDAGCGGGRNSIAISRLGAASVVGIDLSEDGLKDAASRAAAHGRTNIEFQHASILDLPFDSEDFDLVWCAGVLMIVADPNQALNELTRVLKPGGKLYLLVYATGGLRWPLIQLLRPIARILGEPMVDEAIALAGLPPNKRRTFLDDLFCPKLDFYDWERLHGMLSVRGYQQISRWGTAPRLDHEGNLGEYASDLRALSRLFLAGADLAEDSRRELFECGARIIEASVQVIESCERRTSEGTMTQGEAMNAIIGQGHHRLFATKS